MSKMKLLMNAWKNRGELDPTSLQDKAKAFYRMVPLMIKGHYKPKSKTNIIIGLGAVIYAVSPLDLIPEILTGPFGLLDDFVILGYGLKKVNNEIERFLLWEQEQELGEEIVTINQ
ncbi:DUF1232 domain-containing protein [Weeksellaceae bacterium TAE3-ERU29]|nr:DUF1232 domain-containing protein [Weeksellaceae bacterium TAE3-ERU29]